MRFIFYGALYRPDVFFFWFYQDGEDSELAEESTESPDESNYMDNEIEDDGERSEKDDLYYEKDECSMQEYEIMKVSCKRLLRSKRIHYKRNLRIICCCTITRG